MNLLKHPTSYTEVDLLVLVGPAYASLVLQATLWVTPWLGGAPYAPYDPGDAGIVMFMNALFALAFSISALVLGSFRYLMINGAIQLLIYFCAHALPHYFRYPAADILGLRPSVVVLIVGIYALSAVVFTWRRKMAFSYYPSLWFGIGIVIVVGAGILWSTLNGLPANGAYLGYINSATTVPLNAWDWSRAIAQVTAALTIVTAFVLGVAGIVQRFMPRLFHLPKPFR